MSKDTIFNTSSLSKEEQQFIKDRKLKDKFFIGRFNRTESGYLVSDIRRSDFSKIKYKPSKSKAFTIEANVCFDQAVENDSYYRFTWVMVEANPDYVFEVDWNEEIKPILPEDIVKLLYDDIYAYPASASEKIVNTLDTLKNQLTASGKEVFIYELLQNANDYPQKVNEKKIPVDVEFHITDKYLIFQHSGDYFDAKNIAAICSINDKEKTDNVEAIGYKGIGFKTVFLDNNYVLLRTGEYQFRFDYDYTKNIEDTPWQILPIWTENQEVDDEVLNIIDEADEKYRVQIALRPTESDILHYGEQNYEKLFADVFETERVILFIPFVNSVSVYMNGEEKPSIVRTKKNDEWCVSEPKKYVGKIPEELTKELNRRIDKNDGKIPEKYYNFTKTSIGFACRKQGNKLSPVENSCLYCYLPAKKAKLGFGFLMNTDMIPTGPRDNVEPKENINHTIAKIAGEQFFKWIHDLLESNQYDYESVFSLIPDFEELEEKYDEDEDVLTFIQEFKEGFENALKEGTIIPVLNEDGNTELMSVGEVNYDITGITCAGLMTDEELLELTDWSDYFVHPNLRDTENLCLKPCIDRFLNRYANTNYIFDEIVLLSSCEDKAFAQWLSNNDNNSRFLEFLLVRNFIENFKDKAIFLSETGKELKPATKIYYDIDKYYIDLVAFDDYLPRLAMVTREYFVGNVDWDNIKEGIFKRFDADNFVDSTLLYSSNIKDTLNRLRDPKTSFGFFNFLSINVGFSPKYKDFPVISFRSTVIDNFNRKIYFYSKEGEELFEESWTTENWINLLSEEYSAEAKRYVKENFDVNDFSIQSFVDEILLTDPQVRTFISELGAEHIDFVHYCYAHKECFNKGSLKNFPLWTYNKEDENDFQLSEDVIFFASEEFSLYQNKSWIKNGWMFKFDEDYFEGIEDIDDFKQFVITFFAVNAFTEESFYKLVVAKHANDICSNVGGTDSERDTEESIDILSYLGENYKLIFDENANNQFIHLTLYRYDVWDKVTDRRTDVYTYNEDLQNLIEADWTPKDFVYMLEEKYNEVFAKYPKLRKKLEIKTYSFRNIKDILLDDLKSLSNSIAERNENISFHRFMLQNKDEITSSDYKKLNQLELIAIDNQDRESLQNVNDALYISNVYMESGKGIEAMVKKYDETAVFISNAYLSEEADELEASAWREYFIKLGVNSDNKDIIFNSVLPNLSEIEDKDLVSLLANYYDYFHADGKWDNVLLQLKRMNVVVKGGNDDFRPLKDVLFNDCYKTEPFPYLVIEDEIASFYHESADVMRLLREIVDGSKHDKSNDFRSFKTVEEWKKEKLEWYLYLQKEDMDSLSLVHTRFIQDLAKDYTLNYDLYTKVKVKDIKLLAKDGLYHNAKDLTEGTEYQPRCNFEKYGIPLSYLSDCYLPVENPDPRDFRKLFTDMEVVYDFHSEHLSYMRDNYEFAVYFWTDYLSQYANRTHITASGGLRGPIAKELNNYATIPTGNLDKQEVKKPSELYSQSLIQNGFVKNMVPFCDDKMPLEMIFSTDEVKMILDDLDFLSALSFSDCLECLLRTTNKSKRQSILGWLSSKHGIDHILANRYLEDERSVWRNGKGELTRLKDLLVLYIDDDRLRQLFGKNAKVLSQEYMDSTSVFDAFCRIFSIKALKEEDFNLTPEVIEEPTTEEMRQKLRLPLLIIAAVSSPEEWVSFYDSYCQKLDELVFHKCDSITLNYHGILKDSSIQYHKNNKELFFVRDWMGRRVFKDLIFDLVDYFDIDMDNNVLEAIFEADESNQANLIEQYVSYELARDNQFMNTLMELNASIAEGIHVVIDDEDEDENASSFGTHTRSEVHTIDESEEETCLQASKNQGNSDSHHEEANNHADYNVTSDSESEEEVGDDNSKRSMSESKNTSYNSTGYNNIQEEDCEDKQEMVDETIEDNCVNNETEPDDSDNNENSYYEEGSDLDDIDVQNESDESSDEYNEQSSTDSSNHSREHVASHKENMYSNPSSTKHKPTPERSDPKSEKYNDVEERHPSRRSYEAESYGQEQDHKRNNNAYTGRRKNYMGYNPDETKQRPFNVGKQEATTLETKEATEEEISRLSSLLGRAFDKDSIMDENYLVRMRFYNSVKATIGDPQMSEKEFIEKGAKYMQTKNGKYVHRCSARGGILYISPSIWNRVKYDNCIICMYYGKKANQFLYIRSQKELMDMIDKDAVVVQVTGNDKGTFINKVYDSKFPGMNGNIYTMIRTIKTSGDDFIFGENDMSRKNDTDFDPDLI